MVKINIKNIFLFFILFLFLFTPIIPFYEGSLFDYTFLLISIAFWIFKTCNLKRFSRIQFFILIYFLISTVQLFSLYFEGIIFIVSAIPIYLRINACLMLFDLILLGNLKNKSKSNLNYFLIYPFIAISLIFSVWAITESLLGISWRMGFPLYAGGIDPHVFGPAMACAFIGLIYIFFNSSDLYIFGNNRLLRVLIFVDIISCLSATLFCGSRGGLLILLAFSLSYITLRVLKSNFKINIFPTVIKKSKLLVIVFFATFFVSALNYISNASGTLEKLIVRTFTFLPVLTGTDTSRPSQFRVINEVLSSGFNYLFSRSNVLKNADVGVKFFIYNQGFILFILFIIIYISIFILLQRINSISASLYLAGLILLIFGSATLFIPRFYVIYFYSFNILALHNKFRQIPQ